MRAARRLQLRVQPRIRYSLAAVSLYTGFPISLVYSTVAAEYEGMTLILQGDHANGGETIKNRCPVWR